MFDAYLHVYVRQPRSRLRKIVAPARFLMARSAPLSNIFLRDNCRQRFRAARSDPADTGGLHSGTCIARVQVVRPAGRRETTREEERETAMRREGRMCRTYVGRLHA